MTRLTGGGRRCTSGDRQYSGMTFWPIQVTVHLHESHASTATAAAAQARQLQDTLCAARQELDSTAVHLDALATREAELLAANARATRELVAASTQAAEREARLEEQIRHERAARSALEEQIADTAAALAEARCENRSIAAEVARLIEREMSLTSELVERQAQFERERAQAEAHALAQSAGFDDQRREYDRRLAEAEEANTQSRTDNHRLFQQAPMAMFRCTKDGVLTQANRMLTILLGRRSAEELRGADLAAVIFESPNDLSWLIERCVGSRGKESIETTWRRNDGARLLVRLSARATSCDVVECGVEDLTPIRVLHDGLSRAHQMEAVGRLATEVAVTCGSLLDSVHQNAQQWLMTDGSHSVSRHHGEMLLEEISRAAGLLRQLAVYGDEESLKPEVVELGTVVREVAPVLKRVAGEGVEVQLQAPPAPLNVDAGAERVKRLLMNIAVGGRERMPFGGQLKVELGTIVVDRHFAAKHPNVRLGPHALVTVTESRRVTRRHGPLQLDDNQCGSTSASVAVQTGVHLGTLQELVADCGGHLWMTVEPVGDMVVKIRLPLVTTYGEPPRRNLSPLSRVRTLLPSSYHGRR